MDTTWILIADARRARCFERHAADRTLTELTDFIYPHTDLKSQAEGGDLTGAAGKGHGRSAHAGTRARNFSPIPKKRRRSDPALPGSWPPISMKDSPGTVTTRWC